MLKRDITYEDFNGETVTETLYFNLSRTELIELETSRQGGFSEIIQRIIDTKDIPNIIKEFKHIVLLAYGKRSDDGKRFIKNDQLREEFTQTAAYDALFMELAGDEDAAAKFFQGIVPFDISQEIEAVQVNVPPAPPTL